MKTPNVKKHNNIAILFFISESEIDERTEAECVECAEAEHEAENGYHEGYDMLTLVVFGEIYFFLPTEAEFSQGDEREERCHYHSGEEMRVVGEMHRRELEGEKAFDEHPRQVDALDAEETAGEHYDGEGADNSRNPADFFVEILQKQLVGADEDTL